MDRKKPVNLFFNSPSWRWQRALFEHTKRCNGETDFYTCDDILVRGAVRFMNLWEDEGIPKDRVREVFPYYAKLVDIFNDMHPSCTRFCIEAAAMARFPAEDVVTKLGFEVDPLMYDMYKLLFFDIDPLLDTQSYFWIKKNVLAPYEKLGKDMQHSAYVWKQIAYRGGPDVLMDVCFVPDTVSKSRQWMRDFTLGQIESKAMDNSAANVPLPVELESMATSQTISRMYEESKQLASLQSGVDGATVSQLGQLKSSIGMYSSKQKLDKVEQVHSEKYTDKDLIA